MNSRKKVQQEKLDKEWMALILKAKKLGLTTTEVRAFIREVPKNELKK
ncbi:anti-repressor SinI family protein [Cytobacillus sp. FJAT-53684]|uniref:Anti-repressor SinI family protein n=1 Tax=Cytobacillus mangrovibacter TaxID=3299024 RepID=A0ABW6JXP3_9BACI